MKHRRPLGRDVERAAGEDNSNAGEAYHREASVRGSRSPTSWRTCPGHHCQRRANGCRWRGEQRISECGATRCAVRLTTL